MSRFFLFIITLLVCCCQTYSNDYNLLVYNDSDIFITIGTHDAGLDRVTIDKSISPRCTECLVYGTGKKQSWASYLLEYKSVSFYIYEGITDKHFINDYDDNDDIILLAKYVFTLNDMERLNWHFSYPPSDDMKDIEMYPPYSSYSNASY